MAGTDLTHNEIEHPGEVKWLYMEQFSWALVYNK
jgi:hypothetical protein